MPENDVPATLRPFVTLCCVTDSRPALQPPSVVATELDAIAAGAIRSAADDGIEIRISYQLATPYGVLAERDPDGSHYAASTMKLPLVLAAYRRRDQGTLDLNSTVKVHNSFTSRVGSAFIVSEEDDSDPTVWAAMGTEVPLHWLCRRSIIRSSNLATNLVLQAVGFAAVAEAVAACRASGVRVVRMINDDAAEQSGVSNVVTPAGLNAVLLALAAGTAARPITCTEVLAVLADNEVGTDVTQGLPDGVWIAHKNGWVNDAVLDAALVRPGGSDDPNGQFVLSAAVSGRWPNASSHDLIGRLAAAAWRHRD